MANKKTTKRGRTAGAKNFSKAELDVIRLALWDGRSVAAIAKLTGRGRASIYNQINKMTASGEIGQVVLDLGQIESAANDTAE